MACALIATTPLAGDVMAGNQVPMEQARQKAFLLNEHVIQQLGQIEQPSSISLTGRVKMLPDGRWHVVIDDLNVQGPIESGQFPFSNESDSSRIDYVIFEELSGTPAEAGTQ